MHFFIEEGENLSTNYNLSKRRPQIILFGNGLVYKKSWDEVINDLKECNVENTLKGQGVPYPLQSSVLFSTDEVVRNRKYENYFNTTKADDNIHYEYDVYYPLIEKILTLDFDAYLTTNYTYELEKTIHPGYLRLSNKAYYAKSNNEKGKDKKRIKYTYNSFNYNNKEKKVWHIHGEARNKSSIIFTHDDYCRLMGDLNVLNTAAGNKFENSKKEFKIHSWLDYFIVADIYVVGFRLDFSEIDIWWLLNRRLREKSGYGKIYFFEPTYDKETAKYKIMEKFEISHIDVGFKGEPKNYNEFYNLAFNKIKELMEENMK